MVGRATRGRLGGAVLVAGLVLGGGVPVTAEPRVGHASPVQQWTYVNKSDPDRSYWTDERAGMLVGPLAEPRGVYRSLLRFDTAPLAGAVIHSVRFIIVLDRSASCRPTPVDLWRTAPIDPATPLSWRGSRDHWLGGAPLASQSGNACESQLDTSMGFASAELTALLQEAADTGASTVSLGLRAPNERDPRQGKVFRPETAFLVVNYNNPPDAPRDLSTTPPTACGTAEAPTPVTAGTSRTYTTVAVDPDGDNVVSTLEVSRPDGTVVHSVESAPTASGAAFQWPELPQGLLVHGETYRYRAWSDDGADVGPATPYCHIVVDAVAPGVPRVSSTDFPDGEPVIMARTTGTVTFRPAAAGDDGSEYLFGFQQDRITMRVPVSSDGSAVVPVTVTDPTGGTLYARAVDRAGNVSPRTTAWSLQVLDNPEPPADVPGDVTGDGRPDVTAVLGHDPERTTVWNVTARDGGFHTGVVAFDTGAGGNEADRFRTTRGDVTGDGRTDVVMLRRSGDAASLWLLASDGNRYSATTVWESGGPFPFATTRLVAGDFTGDGTTDVAAQVARDGGWEVLVFPGGALGSPTTWHTSDSADWARARVVAADADGDGVTDLVELRAHDGCRTTVLTHRSTGSAFAPGVSSWDGQSCVGPVTAGDVDGDGRDDLVALQGDVSAVVFPAAAGFAPSEWWHGSGQLLPSATPSVGDFDLDGRQDLAVVQSCCAAGETQLWTLRSTGTAFAAPVLGWTARTGGTLPPPR